jgi:pyridoxal phosphate enzyme (YggS family)
MKIKENLTDLSKEISERVNLVAVSKTKSINDILEAYDFGIRDFGENKIQEMQFKFNDLPKDIRWHMIGHVQRNKVKYMAPFVYLIHGVDSFKLLTEINKEALKNNRIINCLFQVRIAKEETKFGIPIEEIESLIKDSLELKNVKIKGLMGMATYTDKEKLINLEFSKIYNLFNEFKKKYVDIEILSIGMSGDYKIAISNGSNMVRIGSKVFGERN